MARLWTCGFELQSATAGVEILSVTGTPTISTTVHRAGAASLRINPSAATQYAEQQITGGVVGRYLHRFYLRVTTLPLATTPVYAIGQSGYFPCYLRLTTTGTLRLHDAFLGADAGTASAALTVGQWYRIEIDHTDVTGAESPPGTRPKGDVIAYVDGVNFSGTAQMSNINGFSRIRMGAVVAGTMDVHIDDVAVNDTTGSVQAGLPGAGNVVHLHPDSAGDNAGFATTVGGTSNWQRASETTPDDATTYNATVATGTTTIDDHNLTSTSAAGVSGERVTLVQVGGRIGSDAATAASLVYRIKSQAAGTVLESASVSVALNGWATHKAAAPFIPQLTSYTDPQAGGVWTTALLDSAQIGYRGNVSQATTRRVSTLWALVETVPLTTMALGTAAETDSALAVAKAKSKALGVAPETGSAQALTGRKTKALGVASETSSAQLLAGRKALALGIASETNSARGLGRPLGQMRDDFNDGTVDTALWPNSFGTYSETGGRARVACDAGYNAFSTALLYTLRDSSVFLRAYAPAGGGATTEAWAQMLIKSDTGGTDLGFELRALTGELVLFNRVGYFDAGETILTYSPTDHAWLRVRESGGTTYWDTSTNGSSWTNRRTDTSPEWAGDTDLEFQLIAHRSDGTDDFAEFDNLNTGVGQTLALAPAEETDSGQPLGRAKARALGPAAETDTAQALGRRKSAALPPAGETSTALALGRSKRLTLGAAPETDSAQPLGRSKTAALSPAVETDTARPLAGGKTRVLAAAAETDTAQPLAGRKILALGPATETWVALPLAGSKRRALGTAVEADAALPLQVVGRRPAEHLSSSVSGPDLTAAAGGPVLAASAGGSTLTVSSTRGG